MSKDRTNKRKGNFLEGKAFSKLLRVLFLLLISFLIVYAYYLHTEGMLLQRIANIIIPLFFIIIKTIVSIVEQFFSFFQEKPKLATIGILSCGVAYIIGFFVGKNSKGTNSKD